MEMAWEAHDFAPRPVATEPVPYVVGDQIQVTDPAGGCYRAEVERIAPDGSGYRLVAAVKAPRRFRDQLVVARVDVSGHGPHVAPWGVPGA